MNYSNPNFNVIVTGPSRTGSTLIRSIFSEITRLAPKLRSYSDNLLPMGPKECLHSHTPSDVLLGNEHTLYIVSKRNLIESTYSNLIGVQNNTWRYYMNTGTVKPFVLDTKRFLHKYETIKNFYIDLEPILPPNALILDYKDFSNDITYLFTTLKISVMSYKLANKARIPTKTPGTYRDWIINFDEIDAIAQQLDPNPCL